MYLLDTNVISETHKIKNGKADPNFVNWFGQVDLQAVYINAVILMEIERGVLGIERKDPKQGIGLRQWYQNSVIKLFENRILTVDRETARICASLHIPNKAPENDAWIAATALQHRLTLVTRNTADFERTGVKLFNPFV